MIDDNKNLANYTSSDIDIKEGLEGVRERPGMYIGNTGPRGLAHLVYEIATNVADEFKAGRGNILWVKILKDSTVIVSDNALGMPTDLYAKKPQYYHMTGTEVVLEILHAGGKFKNKTAYGAVGGLHGVGGSVVNALSDRYTVVVYKEGVVFTKTYSKGESATPWTIVVDDNAKKVAFEKIAAEGQKRIEEARKTEKNVTTNDINWIIKVDKAEMERLLQYSDIDKSKPHGTTVIFHPDPEKFTETLTLPDNIINNMVREIAFLNKGLRAVYINENGDRNSQYLYTNGLLDFMNETMQSKKDDNDDFDVLYEKPFNIEAKPSGKNFDGCQIVMQHDTEYSENVKSYVNGVNTPEHGAHVKGTKDAFLDVINEFATGRKLTKDYKLIWDDVREGMNLLISVSVNDPEFEGQTKGKLGNKDIEDAIFSAAYNGFSALSKLRPLDFEIIIKKAVAAREAREAARKAREERREKNKIKRSRKPVKLKDCRIKTGGELFIVEGDSAGGSANQGRDKQFQASFPIRGKLINVEKADMEKILNNQEIRDLIAIMECGTEDECNPKKCPWGKIIIMTDADVDGSHIRTLLLTFFYRYMKALVEDGRIYIAQPPLYRMKCKTESYYVKDDVELAKIVSMNDMNRHTALIQKFTPDNTIEIDDPSGEMDPTTQKVRKIPVGLHAALDAIYKSDDWDRFFNELTKYTNASQINSYIEANISALQDYVKQKYNFTLKRTFFKNGVLQYELLRFKGLGEMNPNQLKETTMDPEKRTLIKVDALMSTEDENEDSVDTLMGKNPSVRKDFITNNAHRVRAGM